MNSTHNSSVIFENATNSGEPFKAVVSGPAFLGWFGFTIAETIVGFISFLVLFGVFVVDKHIRSGAGVLIGNSMIIQFILATVFFMIFSVGTYHSQTYLRPNDDQFCYLSMFFCFVLFFANSMSNIVMALNRLAALLMPHSYKNWLKKPVLIFMVAIPWIFGIVLNIPFLVGYGATYQAVPPFFNCALTPHKNDPTYMIISTLGFHVPAVLVFLIYMVIFGHVAVTNLKRRLQRNKVKQGEVDRAAALGPRISRRRLNMAKIMFISAMWDCICLIPIPIVVQWYAKWYFGAPYVQLWLRTLVYSAFVPTPIFYFALNSDYRAAIGRLRNRLENRSTVKERTGTDTHDPE